MSDKPRVFVPNDANLEATNLREWGLIMPIFNGYVYPDTATGLDVFRQQAMETLKDFEHPSDSLALVGDPALQALALMVLAYNYETTSLTVLKHDNKLRAYYPVTLRVC